MTVMPTVPQMDKNRRRKCDTEISKKYEKCKQNILADKVNDVRN